MAGKAEREIKTKRGRKRDRDSGRQRIMEGVMHEHRESHRGRGYIEQACELLNKKS